MKKSLNFDFIYGIHAVTNLLVADSTKIKKIIIQKNTENKKLQNIIELADNNKVSVSFFEKVQFDNFLKINKISNNIQGVIAEIEFNKFLYKETDISKFLNPENKNLILILDSIQDPHNMGAIIRTAECLGVDCIIVPKDNSCKINATVFKTSSGAICYLPIIEVVNLRRVICDLKSRGIWIYGATGCTDMDLYQSDFSDDSVAIVMGAEGEGIRKLIQQECDYLIKIPMSGNTESLNVSVATGVILSEVIRQRSIN